MKLVEIKCKNCGSKLKIKKDSSIVHCEYCNTDYSIEEENSDVEKGYNFEKGREKYHNEKKKIKGKKKRNNNEKSGIKKVIWISVIIVLLFILSLVLTPSKVKLIEGKHVTEWLEAASNDKITVLTLGQTTCSHCIAFKPTAEKFINKYAVDWYWIDVDQGSKVQLTEQDIQILNEKFPDFKGTPYTAIVKNGVIIDKINGEAEYADVVDIIKKANGGELIER